LPGAGARAARRPLVRHTGIMKADVVVIGAGALGLSTARHCALAGRSVVIVDRDTAGSQASGRAGAWKYAHYYDPASGCPA
jgi:glycine/D-amino acid oxidase-like deaminating enzyme